MTLMVVVSMTLFSSCDSHGLGCETCEPTNTYSLALKNSLRVDIPVEYYPGERAKFLLNTQEDALLVTTDDDWFYTIDINTGRLGPKRALGISKIRRMSSAFYHNDDSIFFMHDYPPMLLMTNIEGEVYSTRMMGDAPVTDWYDQSSETLYGFNLFYPQSKPYLDDQNLIMLLASEFYYFPNKEKLEFFGSYDLSSDTWSNVFSEAPEAYLESKVETPESHLFPYLARNDNDIVVSYPLSDFLMTYHVEGEKVVFDSAICAKSRFIPEFSEMLPLGEVSSQLGRDYYVTAPAYWDFNYHEKAGVYSRIVRHGLAMLDPTVLPSLCKRSYSVQIFDESLNFLDEVLITEPTQQWAYPIATSEGYILRKRCLEVEDDSYIDFDTFEIQKKNRDEVL